VGKDELAEQDFAACRDLSAVLLAEIRSDSRPKPHSKCQHGPQASVRHQQWPSSYSRKTPFPAAAALWPWKEILKEAL
jgi:hypothetical protein